MVLGAGISVGMSCMAEVRYERRVPGTRVASRQPGFNRCP